MGLVYAEIELINSDDLAMVRRNLMDLVEIKRMHINMMVDTGAFMMAINESIQSILHLPFIEKRRIELANGLKGVYDVVGPVDVRFADRKATCTAFVLPEDNEPLLGAIPMEEMGLLVNPQRQELLALPEPYLRLTVIKPYKNDEA